MNPRQNTNPTALLGAFKKGTVALFIGPHALCTPSGQTVQESLLQYLHEQLPQGSYSFYPDDELFHFKEGRRVGTAKQLMESFFDTKPAEVAFTAKLVDLPVPFIVSASLDPHIETALKAVCPTATADFYTSAENPGKIDGELPTVEKPLFYQIFGSLKEYDSLILTHDDLFKYIAAIMGDKQLHPDFKTAIKGIKHFIFLGFKFEKWYVQLLLQLLNVNNGKSERTSTYHGTNEHVTALCNDQFSIDFVDKNIVEYVNEMYDICKKNNLLRSQQLAEKKNTQVLSTRLIELLEQNEMRQVIDKMKAFFEEIKLT